MRYGIENIAICCVSNIHLLHFFTFANTAFPLNIFERKHHFIKKTCKIAESLNKTIMQETPFIINGQTHNLSKIYAYNVLLKKVIFSELMLKLSRTIFNPCYRLAIKGISISTAQLKRNWSISIKSAISAKLMFYETFYMDQSLVRASYTLLHHKFCPNCP